MSAETRDESFFHPWHLVPLAWCAILGMEIAMEGWISWGWPKSTVRLGVFGGAGAGFLLAALLRPLLRKTRPSWTTVSLVSFVGVALLVGGAELLRGDRDGGLGTLAWGVPVALVAGVVVGQVGRRFEGTRRRGAS